MKVFYVGDNRVRQNFGCRGTSMALYDIIKANHEISSVLYGDMTFDFNAPLYKGRISKSRWIIYWEKLRKKLGFAPKQDEADFIRDDVSESLSNFLRIYNKYAPLSEIMNSLNDSDALMLNGEGTFIFRQKTRYDLNFYLFILSLAQSLGKKTYVLNAMFSDGTGSPQNQWTINQVRDILLQCTHVVARDVLSLKYYQENIGSNAIYIPDALFSWTKYESHISLAKDYPLAGVIFPDSSWQWEEFDFSKPYVAVSAGSRTIYGDNNLYIEQYVKLVNALKQHYRVIIQETCGSEIFLQEVAKISNTKIIDNRTNILFGMSVLANAQCYVSGRWHPSILASIGGTPCVMLGSNSHKSLAIYKELKYEHEDHVYPNPPSDEEIKLIVKQVEYSIKNISRDKIKSEARKNSDMLQQYNHILK